jgi:hypothetical protein
MNFIFTIFTQSKSKVYKQLRGNAIECSTIIGKICGNDRFEPYYRKLIEQMIIIQNTDIETDKFDPQKSYLLAGWQRMVIAIEDKFKPYIPMVLPKLLELAKLSHMNTENANIRTSDSEETEISVQTIAVFLDNLGVDLFPYITEIFNVLHLIIENSLNDETRMEAIKCLPGLIKIFKKSNNDVTSFGRHLNQTVWNLMDKEHDTQNLSEYAYTLQKILKHMGPVLSDEELNGIYSKCIEHLKRSVVRKNDVGENFDKEEENADDIENIINSDQQMEEEFALEIANIIGILFRVYKERSLHIFSNVYSTLIVPSLQQPKAKSQHFGLFLVDDAVEHIGNLISPAILAEFLQITSNFSLNVNLELRQAALFGVGIVANALGANFQTQIEPTLKLLSQAIEMPKQEDDNPKYYLTVKENAVSAFGKILQTNGQFIQPEQMKLFLIYWLRHLPILHDHKEAVLQHKFLITVVTSPHDILGVRNPDILKRLVEIFLRIHHKKKICSEEMQGMIKTIIRGFFSEPSISQIMQTIAFDQPEKEFLTRMIQQ